MQNNPPEEAAFDDERPTPGEDRYRLLVEQSPIVLWEADPVTFDFRFVSAFVEELLGYPRVAWYTAGFWASRIHSDDRAQVLASCGQAVAARRDHKLEYRLARADGRVIWVEDTVKVTGEGAHLRALRGAMVDVTERKSHERSLQLFRTLTDRLDDAIEVIDAPTARFLDVNDRGCLDLGYSRDELLALRVPDIDPHVSMPVYQQNLEKLRQTGTFKLETVHRRRDGSCFPVEINARLVQLDREYILTVARDITTRKEAERQLAETSRGREEALALLDTLHAEAPVGLAFVNCDFRFVRCNDALAEIDGVSAAAHLGKTVAEIVPRLWPQIEPKYHHILSGKGPVVNYEIAGEIAARPGSTRHWLVNFYPVNIGAEIIGIGVIVHEVTERRNLEEQIRDVHKMEAIGRLAGGIAHDFNNLLTVINGYSSFLLDPLPSDHPQRHGLIAIQDAGHRAAALVRQLLTFSRGQVLQPTILDLNEVIGQSESFFRRLLGGQIQLVLHCEPGLANIRNDRSQMEQILINFVVNARDAMPQGGRLEIQTQNVQLWERRAGLGRDLPPGPYIQLSVADTGHGMTAAVKTKIFEPFFTTKEVGKGTGLGLCVVHGIVQQSGGHIEIESEVGVGTRFTILLPAVGERVSGEW